MTENKPEIQLIANVVVQNEEGKVLLVKYNPEDDKWWLPGDDLETYQHPDARAKQILDDLKGLAYEDPSMVFVESFRGRQGWHVMFNYSAKATGQPSAGVTAEWFSPDDMPRTMHGRWEREVVRTVVES